MANTEVQESGKIVGCQTQKESQTQKQQTPIVQEVDDDDNETWINALEEPVVKKKQPGAPTNTPAKAPQAPNFSQSDRNLYNEIDLEIKNNLGDYPENLNYDAENRFSEVIRDPRVVFREMLNGKLSLQDLKDIRKDVVSSTRYFETVVSKGDGKDKRKKTVL